MTDSRMVHLMRNLGVETPEPLALDESLAIVPSPFALYRRVPDAEPISSIGNARTSEEAWRETGRQLARVHQVLDRDRVPFHLRSFHQTPEFDPRPWVEALRANAHMSAADASWLLARLDNLAPLAFGSAAESLCHGDVNAANILIHEATGAFLAIIDWAGAGWLDPVWDFVGVPLPAVPFLLAGNRSVAPLPDDHNAEARVFWCQAQTRLHAALGDAERGIQPVNLDRDIRHLRRFAADALDIEG
jgi:aminoglycoside phosphotransferase (APT) family kinase protein